MNFEFLNTYLTVVKVGSFSEAAKILYITQPAISIQIKKLEQELGVRLVERGKKGVSMTYSGRLLYNFWEYAHHEYGYMLRDIERTRNKTLAELTIITSAVSGEYVIPVLLTEFKENHTLSGVNLVISDSLKVIEDVKNGLYEIGFCSTKVESPELEFLSVLDEEIVLIVFPGHLLSNRKEVSFEELSGESLILREPSGVKFGDTKQLVEAGLDLELFKLRFVMGTMPGLLSMVESRVGIGFLPLIVAKKSEALGLVKTIKIKNKSLRRAFYCVFRKGKEKSPFTQEFIDFLKNRGSNTTTI